MIRSAVIVLALATAAGADSDGDAGKLFEMPGKPVAKTAIDKAVFGRLAELGIEPAPLCSDPVFLRRAYLDVTGTIPTAGEAMAFLGSRDPDKRAKLIDELLAREEYAVYWAMHWSDVLRVKAEFPINLWPNAAQAYYLWIRSAVADNMPYDVFVREQLTRSGSNFRVPPVNFYRAMQSTDPNSIAKTVALTFLGARADKWDERRIGGLAALFRHVGYKRTMEWKEEIVYFDAVSAAEAGPAEAILPDGKELTVPADADGRKVFADWLIRDDNPWFARCGANRVWAWLMGRGVIHEVDDIRPDNPPSNPALLKALADELVRSDYDMKRLIRTILTSQVYQLSSIPHSDDKRAGEQFAYYHARRMEAEVLIDAVCQVTDTTESYSSPIPEPFTWIPERNRSIALPDGSITSSFLDMFGRSPRDTGILSERNNVPTGAQCLHLLNSTHIHRKVYDSKKLQVLMQYSGEDLRPAVVRLYLTILSRFPTEAEVARVKEYAKGEETGGVNALKDLAWALVNSTEFLYRH